MVRLPWSTDVNGTQRGVNWLMKIDYARCKLKSVYPKMFRSLWPVGVVILPDRRICVDEAGVFGVAGWRGSTAGPQ